MPLRRKSTRALARPRALSIDPQDLHLTSAVKREAANGYHGDGYNGGLDSPYGSQSEQTISTPTTPNGHPLSKPNPFQSLLRPGRVQPTPLPVLKILPLCIARMAEGLIFAVIFPYINEMMHGMGVPEESVGMWSATAESTLMVTEALAAPFYAPIADRIGRRPVFIPLVFAFGFVSVAFGFASTPFGVVVLRACLGLLAGVGVLSRTMLSELCDKTNRVEGFAFFSPALTMGVTIAPLIGGFLSQPVPRLLPPTFTLFLDYPYLLPSAVAGGVGFAAAISAYKFLPETLPPALRTKSGAARHEAEKTGSAGGFKALMSYPRFVNVLVLYALSQLVMFSWEAVFPLFFFTSKEHGGLALSTPQIGIILAVSAALSIVMTAVVFPRLHKRMPEGALLRFALTMYPLGAALFPLMWSLSHRLPPTNLSTGTLLTMAVQMLMRRIADISGTLLDTMVVDAIPGPEYLAMANSITFSTAGIGRAVGPFIVSSFFSLSTTSESALSVKRQIVWVVMAAVSFPSLYFAQKIVGEGRRVDKDEKYDVELESALED